MRIMLMLFIFCVIVYFFIGYGYPGGVAAQQNAVDYLDYLKEFKEKVFNYTPIVGGFSVSCEDENNYVTCDPAGKKQLCVCGEFQ